MARATRSSTQQHDVVIPAAVTRTTKKRKRASTDTDDHPAIKQLRTDASINGDVRETNPPQDDAKLQRFQNAGDVPIDSGDAQKILDILEMVDTQGLLDRVFPLPPSSVEPSSQPKPSSHSFRTLLKESSQHPLCVLRAAVQHLLPISSHPRSRPSTPAAQQLRFCNLSLSLLDQASFQSVRIPPDLESIFPLTSVKEETDDTKPVVSSTVDSPSPVARKRKYALMQRLPTGDYWTSLSFDASTDAKDLKDLPVGYAELVAILPSAAPSPSSATPPTLGSYKPKKSLAPRPKLPQPRQVSCGSFLDYGPFASFAPSFDQAGVEIGRSQLGEVVWGKEERKSARKAVLERIVEGDGHDIDMIEAGNPTEKSLDSVEDVLDGLLSKEQIEDIKSTLGSLELEAAVQELLERNARALKRLEDLQVARLASEGGGTSDAEVGSEEWDTAQGVLDSLTLLASLRPRSSSDKHSTLIPPISVFHKLQRTLPLQPTPGWHGTLPPSRATSLRDDSTIHIKAGTSIPATVPAPAASPANATTMTTPQAFPGYNYSPYGSQQFRGGYAPYKTGQQSSSYYPGYPGTVTQSQGQQQPAAQGQPQSYYGAQFGISGHQQYAYGSWYNYQTAGGGASTNGRGTPQPATGASTPSTSIPTNYAGFFNSSTQPPQRAVANTVTTNKQWGGTGTAIATGYAPPTLPAHLRSAATTTPQPGTPGGYQPAYFGSYTPTATR